MNILVIGNGFDIAHGLPTKYTEFIDFLSDIDFLTIHYALEIQNDFSSEKLEQVLLKKKVEGDKKSILFPYLCKIFSNEEVMEEKGIGYLQKLVNNNFWYHYFISFNYGNNERWVDLESEISKILQFCNRINSSIISHKNYREFPVSVDEISMLRRIASNTNYLGLNEDYSNKDIELMISFFSAESIMKEFIDLSMIHFMEFTYALELYLLKFVSLIEIKEKFTIFNSIQYEKILNFNYTSTFEDIYKISKEKNSESVVEYVHGKLQENSSAKKNKMVLGIEDYLDVDEIDSNTFGIKFKKYYQLIDKKIGSDYREWLTAPFNPFNLYIYGHSLDKTDKYILEEFINKSSKTTIYCYDQDTYETCIANLVQIIGRDNLISRTYSGKESIIFEKIFEVK